MTIISNELQAFKSLTVTNDATNGGLMSANAIVSGVLQNVFPHVFKAERESGSTIYRKVFFKVANDNDETLLSPLIYFDGPTGGDDWVYFHVGTQSDTQADITGSERKYGTALTTGSITAGDSTIVVDVEDASLTGIFQDGDKIRLTNKATPDSLTGTEEELTISGAPVVASAQVTITVSGTIANSYAIGSKVSTIYEPGDISTSVTDPVVTSASGTFDHAGTPIVADNIGTIFQNWTLTFSDATNYTCSGHTVGSVGAGTISGNFEPPNADWTKPYFIIDFAAFGGTFANGDTITFTTNPAAVPIWETRVVPAGASSLANNSITAVFAGES